MKILCFPELRQAYEYDCGASALQSVLAFYGIEKREEVLIAFAHTNKRDGTEVKDMLNVLSKFGLTTHASTMTIGGLTSYIDTETPIIILVQAWGETDANYATDTSNGHWVVVIGYDNDRIIFEDPYTLSRTYLHRDELLIRWHGKNNGKELRCFGIAITGKVSSYNPRKLRHME